MARKKTIIDFQRNKLYRAEGAAFEGTRVDKPVSIASLQRLLDRAFAMPMFAYVANKPIHIKINNRFRTMYARATWDTQLPADLIEFREGYTKPCTFVHELAHILAYRSCGGDIPAHGPHFVNFYLALVSELLGKGRATVLARCFKAAGIEQEIA